MNRYWYFYFEGVFEDSSRREGLYSSAMLSSADEKSAQRELKKNLSEEGIRLVDVEESFEFKISEVDPNNKDNIEWLSMYEEAERTGGCIYTPWHVFPLEK